MRRIPERNIDKDQNELVDDIRDFVIMIQRRNRDFRTLIDFGIEVSDKVLKVVVFIDTKLVKNPEAIGQLYLIHHRWLDRYSRNSFIQDLQLEYLDYYDSIMGFLYE